MISVAVTPRMDKEQSYAQREYARHCTEWRSRWNQDSSSRRCCTSQVGVAWVQTKVVIREDDNKEGLRRKREEDVITGGGGGRQAWGLGEHSAGNESARQSANWRAPLLDTEGSSSWPDDAWGGSKVTVFYKTAGCWQTGKSRKLTRVKTGGSRANLDILHKFSSSGNSLRPSPLLSPLGQVPRLYTLIIITFPLRPLLKAYYY